MPIDLAIAGAAGRMGQRIVALAAADPRFRLAAALDRRESGRLGEDAGEVAGAGRCGVRVSEAADAPFDVLVDFSSAAATAAWLELCLKRDRPIVIGTTGHSVEQTAAIDAAAQRIAVLRSANFSVGVNALLRVVEQLTRALGDAYDVEVIETHHRMKSDAPSGTALALTDAVVRGRGGQAAPDVVFGRHGQCPPRPAGQIGIHSVRAGDVVGEHEVQFSTAGESVMVRHVARSRDTFARGALTAAAWLVGRSAGSYSMADVLSGAGG